MLALLTAPLALLTRAGRHGPAVLFGGVLTGLLLPPLAELARPLMGLAVLVFTLGAFLKVDRAGFRAELATPWALLALVAWISLGVPVLAWLLVTLAAPSVALAQGLLLNALAPPVGSAAAIAAMLRLSAPLALIATVLATAAAPFYLPPLAAGLAGTAIAIEPWGFALRLAVIIGGAGLASLLLRRFAGRWVAANPQAMTGISVVGLLVVALGAMRGLQDEVLAAPAEAALFLALAFAANAGLQAVGALLFATAGLSRLRALTVGLLSGNRNVTLVWAAAAPSLAGSPKVELYLAMAVFPIFMLPAALRWVAPPALRLQAAAKQMVSGAAPPTTSQARASPPS